nr:hypothetical protein [Streptococcus dysgalactiae]
MSLRIRTFTNSAELTLKVPEKLVTVNTISPLLLSKQKT